MRRVSPDAGQTPPTVVGSSKPTHRTPIHLYTAGFLLRPAESGIAHVGDVTREVQPVGFAHDRSEPRAKTAWKLPESGAWPPATRASRTPCRRTRCRAPDRKSTRLNSSHANISYAVFCLKKTRPQHACTRSRLGRVAATTGQPLPVLT